ncbi:anti-sigma factor domain-containing protein [Kineococcus gynurae]|uniref:Regulator of SigK n=1 Tax=Kineococcus gynurae TaxID=452979 RepID=A0ABV5LX60_9ACTN
MKDRTDGRTPDDGPDDADLAAWALDALDPTERAAVERRLDVSPAAAQRADEFQDTAARLADAVAVAPPEHLRASILAAVAATPQEPAADASSVQESTPGGTVPAEITDLALARSRRSHRSAPRRADRGRRGWQLAAAACLVAAVAGGVSAVDARRDADSARAEVVRLTALADQGQVAEQQVHQVLASSDSRTVRAEAADGGLATMVMGDGHALVVTSRFPELHDRTYQLWLVDGDRVTSAGLLGSTSAATMWVENTGTAQAVAISVEPVGGSRVPTTAPVLLTNV